MLTRAQKNVPRKEGIDVQESNNVSVLINHIRRNDTRNDLAENTTIVSHPQYGSSVARMGHLGDRTSHGVVANTVQFKPQLTSVRNFECLDELRSPDHIVVAI